MTLQHEADYPVPEGIQPSLERTLQVILRELDQVLVPELQSDRARTTASLLSQTLRQLIIRETILPALLKGWTDREEALLSRIGAPPPHAPTASAFERHQLITAAIATAAGQRAGQQSAVNHRGVEDPWTREAIRIEREHVVERLRVERELPHLQRTQERTGELDVTSARVEAYLRTKLPASERLRVTKVSKILGGFSKETFIIDAELDGQRWPAILRRDVPLGAVAGSVVEEAPLLTALHARGLAVPEILAVESDRTVLGEAFTITRRAPGETAFSNMRGLQMDSGQQDAARALAEVLGQLHSLDPNELDLPPSFFDARAAMADCVVRQIDAYEHAWLSRTSAPSPTMSAAFGWLRSHIPPSCGIARIVHGDAGLHNLMLANGRVSALLDWELSHMGDPIEDLAYCRTWIDQALPWDEFLEVYYRNGGHEYRPEYERFYGVLSNLRIVVFAAQSAYGTHWNDHPELPPLFAATHYHAVFLDKVAEQLLRS
ncbi:MAG: phosphotransferase family protein [Steroidobacteraceae bacterium]